MWRQKKENLLEEQGDVSRDVSQGPPENAARNRLE